MQRFLKEKDLTKIITIINNLLAKQTSVVVALDGMCTSGKSTLADELSQFFDTRIIHVDDFYLPRGTRDLSVSNDGNINLERLKEEIIDKLNNNSLIYRKFSCKEQKINEEVSLVKTKLTIIEGSYSLNPYFGHYYDLSIFMKIDIETQLERLKIRNKDNFEDFVNRWIVLENRYNKQYKIEEKADLIIVND